MDEDAVHPRGLIEVGGERALDSAVGAILLQVLEHDAADAQAARVLPADFAAGIGCIDAEHLIAVVNLDVVGAAAI